MKLQSLLIVTLLTGLACSRSDDKSPNADETIKETLANEAADLGVKEAQEKDPVKKALIQKEKVRLEKKLAEKRQAKSLYKRNSKVIAKAMQGHTSIYPLTGSYKVLVIPVQFQDASFAAPEFFKPDAQGKVPAQDYLFGKHKDSMSEYYKHSSLGALDVKGELAPIVTLDGTLADYGEATENSSDKNARGLVAQALVKVMADVKDSSWWNQFDNWDLGDYDADEHYAEPDGFLDAVVVIYAGKSQSSCQAAFDQEGTRPSSASVPPGPRHDATVECFNRLWPHRWSLSIPKTDPLYSENGPLVEGIQRPAMNGLKITDELFALDYNMQSEFSDRSTFIHEFGHSLSLPDVYANPGENSTGSWEIMSNNASLQGQEFSSYSKISLGWMTPKLVQQGHATSLYLGNYSFVANERRNDLSFFTGPQINEEDYLNATQTYDILSATPGFGEAVYRSAAVVTEPTVETIKVIPTPPEEAGHLSAYTGRFDGESRSLKYTFDVPTTGNAVFKFKTIYQIETETNFNGVDEEIRVVTDYDIGKVIIDGDIVEELRTVSGDTDANTLVDLNPACEEARVLELRLKKIASTWTEEEQAEFKEKLAVCVAPIWVEKSFDLEAKRGKTVEIEIQYLTDAGYTEFGIVVDNIALGDTTIDFEDGKDIGEWKLLKDGEESVTNSQFYLMEYRETLNAFKGKGSKTQSYNMDLHINQGQQSFFLPDTEGLSQVERFRLVTMDYQPGVLVWYFNSKFTRSDNNGSLQEGQGYLLAVNPNVGEMVLPGVYSDPKWFDENGHYDVQDPDFVAFNKDQNEQFVCFSHTAYAAYQTGEQPVCEGEFLDAMQNLSFGGKKLRYRRAWFNEILPKDRYAFKDVGKPFRTYAAMRTGLSTFRPETAESFQPFKVYKAKGSKMVLDKTLTALSLQVQPKSTFSDKDQKLSEFARFKGDTAIVEKSGFNFKVVEPGHRITESYDNKTDASANNNVNRRPMAKVLIHWD
jgi:M6 family metalloprotease-like protein